MQQRAVVTKVLSQDFAEILVTRQSACGHDCSECSGCETAATERIRATARNEARAQVGDSVVIEGESKAVFRAAAVVYLVPFVLFFLLYGVASAFGAHDGYAALSGGIGFALGVLAALGYNHKVRHTGAVSFTIIKKM